MVGMDINIWGRKEFNEMLYKRLMLNFRFGRDLQNLL